MYNHSKSENHEYLQFQEKEANIDIVVECLFGLQVLHLYSKQHWLLLQKHNDVDETVDN
ncbi:hypothetical protein RDWZM_006062, partial [Blomia tropicalis]